MLASLGSLVTSPHLLGLMLLTIPLGIFFGAVPGLGGKLGVVLLIPFVFGMNQTAGAVFLLSMHSIVHTGGSIPSILFGVPGTGPNAATIVDGYPMAQKGEAGRALGASLTASGVGGVIGALVIVCLMPVLQPVLLAFSPAEFFLLALLGLTFIAVLSRGAFFKGLAVGLFGVMLSFVGEDPFTGIPRYAGHALFLWNGIDLITAILAMFAIPEMIARGVKGGAVSEVPSTRVEYSFKDLFRGAGDVFRHRWLTLRTSIIGTVIGMIPGLGGDVASWICYGHAAQSSKDQGRFGKGAVEGVIAPETANNAKEAGALLPTLGFGIPGSSGMAVLMGALLILGIQPGPTLIATNQALVWTLIWTLVIANVFAVIVLFVISRWIGLLAFIRGGLLIPFVFVLCVLGAYLSSTHWQDLLILTGLSAIGYFFLKYGWPRPPFVIGIVLGRIAEQSLHKALALWGVDFFLRPISLLLVALIVTSITIALVREYKDHVARQ